MRNRKRGITFIEIVVAMSFVLICTATLADSIVFSTETIDYNQRRVIIQASLQSTIDEVKTSCLTALPIDSTVNTNITIQNGKTVIISRVLTAVSGKNVTRLQVAAQWPESRGSRNFTDTMTFEVYLRGPDGL
ncbi:MAG: hypothetical protein WCG75_06300 [Armatimonadota bacterium]